MNRLLLEGVVGSTAYGLATDSSDLDYTGIYVQPTADLLGLHPPQRERGTIISRTVGVDSCCHEIGKAMALMLSCNPTASEILWLEEWTHATDEGLDLIGLRECFLSARRVRNSYFGYATSQFSRLIERGRFAGSLETRREKHARHLMRLLWQGHTLYTTGHLPIRVENPERFHDFGRRIAADPDATAARELLAEYETLFDNATTVLPDEPPLEDLLQRIRRRAYLTDQQHGITP
ncbi:DNA polymerase beta superfamily protein [Nocardia sp. SYP-A9097]|uniref:nucleotidyltransferase domain-containing protein n=1 Tax=Nocardia sp. SYP-A9097 TaxID=2663237 RepID=UPI00281643AA|nr:nucleotidyltransferase domain-containing protein [Nocardia sp. SYP-A9097]